MEDAFLAGGMSDALRMTAAGERRQIEVENGCETEVRHGKESICAME